MNRPAFLRLIESVITNQIVFVDILPEDESVPACTYSHIVGGGSRLLNGVKVNEFDTWRVRVIGNNRTECDAAIRLLKPLDNTRSAEFKRILVTTVQGVPSLPDDDYVSSFIDFKTFDV
jgi:hypothetical protein